MNIRPLIHILICFVLAALACNIPPTDNNALQSATVPPSFEETEPASTVSTAASDVTSQVAEFLARLQAALVNKDFSQIRSLMGDAFLVRYIGGASGMITVDDAITLMQQNLLAGQHPLTFDETIAPDQLIGNSLLVEDPPVLKATLSRGWGETGADQAIVLICSKSDGSPFFSGLIYARGGFAGVATSTSSPTLTNPISATPSGTVTLSLPTPDPAPHGAAVYETDFKTGWTLFNETNVKSQHTPGGYQVDVQGTWAGWSFTTKVSKADFYAEITTRPIQCPENQGNYGLMFHYQDDNHFRLFLIWCNGRYTLTERTEGVRARLLTEGRLPDQIGPRTGDHRIGVLSQGNNVTLYIEDIQLTTVGVGEIVTGDVGPYVETTGNPATSVLFTHLIVYDSK